MTTQLGYGEATARIVLTGDSQEMNCTQGFEVETPPFTQSDADDVCNYFADFLRSCMSSSYTVIGGRVAIGNDGGDIIFESTSGQGAGSQGALAVPQNTAFLFRKTTASGGRRNRGRMFVPGITEGSVNSTGGIDATDALAYQAAADLFVSSMAAGGWPLVILHPAVPEREPKVPTPALAAATPTPVTSLILQPVAATQRRRLR